MAQVLAPGVAQTVLSGLYGAQKWAVVWHWAFDGQTGAWSSQSMAQLCNAISAQWGTYAAPLCATTVVLQQVSGVDIGVTAPVAFTNTTVHAGTSGAAQIENSAICTLINMHINARYRGGHPRTYLPWGVPTNQTNESTWNAGYLANAAGAMANIVNQVRASLSPVNGAQVSQVCVRYNYTVTDDPIHKKYVRQRSTLNGVFVVQNYSSVPTYGTQRRRLVA